MITMILSLTGIGIAGAIALCIKNKIFGHASRDYNIKGSYYHITATIYRTSALVDCLDTLILSSFIIHHVTSLSIMKSLGLGMIAGITAFIILFKFDAYNEPEGENVQAGDFYAHLLLSVINGGLLSAVVFQLGLF